MGSGTVFDATEGTAMSNEYEPILVTNSHSQIGCFMKVNFKKNPCHVLQVQETRSDQWRCLIFSTTDDLKDLKMVDNGEATVYTTHLRAEKCKKPQSCLEHYTNGVLADGVYEIEVNGKMVSVFCDMTTEGGGWTVFQKRVDGSVDFFRDWNDYVQGFGDPATNYWLGLEVIHQLTKRDAPTNFLAIGKTIGKKMMQSNFYVGDASTNYKLHAGEKETYPVNGDKNVFKFIDGMQFSTKDRDNDINGKRSCANDYHSGWWYAACYYYFHPNGFFGHSTTVGIRWQDGQYINRITMAIRKQN